MAFKLNGNPLAVDVPFTVGTGEDAVNYPANWLRLSTAEEKTAAGITEVADPTVYDSKFYWGDGTPKTLADENATDKDGNLIDPYGGMEDIRNKLLKSVSASFDEDPLRVLRVARFASKLKFLDFKIENKTLEQMKKISSSGEIETLSKERVWVETYKALSTSNPEEYFSILLKVGALEKICQPIDLNLNALEKTSSDNQDHTIKWSVSVSENENIEKINNSFNAPKEFSEISEICSQINLFSSKKISPESLMDLVNKCDLLRKPERFYKASKASSYIIESSLKPEKWIEIYDLLSDVSVDKTLREGKLIAKKLNTDRLAAIKNYLEKL